MHRTSVEQWLSERGIALEQGFVPALKDCIRAYKKRLASAWSEYTAS